MKNKILRPVVVLMLAALTTGTVVAREPATRPTVINARVTAHWIDNTHFWYERTGDGGKEFVQVDAATGVKSQLNRPPATSRPATQPDVSLPPELSPPKAWTDASGKTCPSPDRSRVAVLKENNLFIGTTEGDLKPATTGGTAERPYAVLFWSPDGKSIAAYRKTVGNHESVYRLESSPRAADGNTGGGAGRALLQQSEYALPGDKLDSFSLTLIDVENGRVIDPKLDPIDANEWGSHPFPNPRWRGDGRRFIYEKYDRGHQRVRLIEVDALTGASRTLLDERSETFIWSAHLDLTPGRLFYYLPGDKEVLYVSERSGWRQLYLLNLDTAELKPVTQGAWVLKSIGRIDSVARQIWFTASGVYPDQDPYYVHVGRVNFDGTGLTWLTDANGTHDNVVFGESAPRPRRRSPATAPEPVVSSLSPDWKFLIVRHSRVDSPPITELRRTSDGKLITVLETATVQGDWRPLIPFAAKGRDGTTDIYGVIRLPADFDPAMKYPVVENVYAGPQGFFTPKGFRPDWWYDSLADLGFIVVQADGMGTAGRSKAFHDVCWKNLADAGFPDRIAWMKAAAQKYPQMDLSRVGIYGTSSGGQTAMGALLFHNDFYKAAVANCGCHDNRMDKISWNEQWMGWPVGAEYSACSNIDNASKLKGRLQLVLGELDDNVPVESTYRLVNALVRAGKEFDFVVIPGAGHGAASPVTERKLQNFFVKWLQGIEPVNPN